MQVDSTPSTAPKTTAKPRAFVYCRVSSEGQEDGASLSEQERICREYAAERGYSVAGVFHETYDGEEVERPVLSRLLAAGKRGEGDAVLVWKQDRLGRGTAIHVVMYLYEGAGLEPLCVLEPFSEGIIATTVRGIVSGEEKRNIKLRTQGGRKARARAGKLIAGSHALYGYRWRDEKKTAYDVDDATAPIVARVFAELSAGKTLRQVAGGLEDDGIPTPFGGKQWNGSTIRRIALHESYTGRAYAYASRKVVKQRVGGVAVRRTLERPEDERIPLPEGTIPRLVSDELARAVRDRLARNKQEAARRNRQPESFLLRAGFVKCGQCGKAASARMQTTPEGERVPVYFVQRTRFNHSACTGSSIRAGKLDAEIWAFVETVLDKPERIFRRLEQMGEEDTTADELAAIDRALAAVAKKRASFMRVAEAVDDEDAAADVAARLDALSMERKEYEGRRANVLARRHGREARQEQLRELAAWIARTRIKLEVFTTPLFTQDEMAGLRAAGVDFGAELEEWATTPPGAPVGDLDLALLEVTQEAYRMERERNPPSYQKRREWLAALGLTVTLYPDGHEPRYRIRTDLSNAIVDGTTR